MSLVIWAYCFLSRFAVDSLCYKSLILSFKNSAEESSGVFGCERLWFFYFNDCSSASIYYRLAYKFLILASTIFLALFFSFNSPAYLDNAANPPFLLSVLLLIRNFCSYISFLIWSLKTFFYSTSLSFWALNFSLSGFARIFLGASGTGVYKRIYLRFQLYWGRFARSGFCCFFTYFTCLT